MTDKELIEALRHRLPNEVRASGLVPIVREYAEEFAAAKLREAAEHVDLCCASTLERRADLLDRYR